MKRIFLYFLLLSLAVLGMLLARLNADEVTFNFYFSSLNVSLAVLIYAAIVVGAFGGVLLSVALALRARREAGQLRRRLRLCEQEIKNLREIPIKDQF